MLDFDFSPILVIVVFASIVLSIVKVATMLDKKAKQQAKESTKLQQQVQQQKAKKLQPTKQQPKAKSTVAMPTVQFDGDHNHVGDSIEQYEPISGSLGQVRDEGCVEMDGFRLIANDDNFDAESGETNFNLNKVAQAIVLGEILDKPRFKNPPNR